MLSRCLTTVLKQKKKASYVIDLSIGVLGVKNIKICVEHNKAGRCKKCNRNESVNVIMCYVHCDQMNIMIDLNDSQTLSSW